MAKKKKDGSLHENIKGFDISINQFGEIVTTLPIDRLNAFLNSKEKEAPKEAPEKEENTED